MKYMDLQELVDSGMLQEVNRKYLHPIGLALVVSRSETGELSIAGIWDARDDPEGILFEEIDREKVEKFHTFERERIGKRIRALGYVWQPYINVEK